MKKIIILLTFIAITSQLLTAQSPVLVEDYILGPQGSIAARIYEFQNTLTYEGTTQNGMHGILQYDKNTNEIQVLATDEDFDGNIKFITSNTEEMYILSGDVSSIRSMYKTYESDFSDIQKLYDSNEAQIRSFRIYNDHTLISEENFDGVEYTTNIKVVHPNETIKNVFSELPGRGFDYSFTAVKGHFIIAPKESLIDGKSIVAYNIETREIVPITDVLPDFEECGLISRIGSINESIFYYWCDINYIYDLNSNQYIDYGLGSFFLNYDKGDYLYLTYNASLYKINKVTGEQNLIIDQIKTSRGYISTYVMFTNNGDLLDVSYFDFEEEKLYTYSTDYPNDVLYRLTGFGVVPSGVHFILYETIEDNGVIININADSFTEIDSVFNVNFNNRPVAYGEDIYYTNQDPEVGNELFLIDYEVNSTQQIDVTSSIKISPNPALEFIIINHQPNTIPVNSHILDITGNLVLKLSNHNRQDISSLPSGLYFLHTYYKNGGFGMDRFIVE